MKTRITSKASRVTAPFLLLVVPLACARAPEEPDATGPADPQASRGPADAPRADVNPAEALPLKRTRTLAQGEALMRVGRQVPHAMRANDCGARADTDTCAWAHAADAVVVATVREVRLVDTPVAGPAENAAWKWYGACAKVAPALEIELDVEQDLRSKLGGTTTIVRVGKRQLDTFVPHPSRAKDGSLRWSVAEGEAGPLQPGQRVLAALHYVKGHNVWSLMGEMMSAVDDDGIVRTPRAGCLSRVPSELDDKSESFALGRLGACLAAPPSAAGLELRSKRLRAWGGDGPLASATHPASFMAAECLQPDFAVPAVEEDDK